MNEKTHARSIRRIHRRKLYTAGRRAEHAALLLFFRKKNRPARRKTVSPLRAGALCLALFRARLAAHHGVFRCGKACREYQNRRPHAFIGDGPDRRGYFRRRGDLRGGPCRYAPSATSAPTGERPYLGVIVQTVSCAAAEYYNGSDSNAMVPGVQIYAVEDGGPASVAGLCSGDIIIRLNGADIATAADLTAAENALTPGCKTSLIVYRAGEVPRGAGRARRAARRGRRRGSRLV